MYCDENNFNSFDSPVLEELNPLLEEIGEDKVADEGFSSNDEWWKLDFLKTEDSSSLVSQDDETKEQHEDLPESTENDLTDEVVVEEENTLSVLEGSEVSNSVEEDEVSIVVEEDEVSIVVEEDEVPQNVVEESEVSNVIEENDEPSVVEESEDINVVEEVLTENEESLFTVIEEEPVAAVEETVVTTVKTNSVPVNVPVMENSTVNITAWSINVEASKVVLSQTVDEQVESVNDFKIKDSHKGNVVLLDDESVIKQYRLTKGDGKAIVTNRRLIIDCKTRLDLPIENVGGVASSFHTEIKVVKLIFGVLFFGICLFACLFDFKTVIHGKMWAIYTILGVGGVFGLIGLLLICFSFKKKFFLNIFGEGLTPVMSISSTKRDASNSLYGIAINGQKGKDFAKFTGEIGALLLKIKDAQKRK